MQRADVAIMSPYQEDNVRRFGDYIYELNVPLEIWRSTSIWARQRDLLSTYRGLLTGKGAAPGQAVCLGATRSCAPALDPRLDGAA
ncbi:MAG: hypothetical protein K0R62_6572 [Nonomuraea muscovyensis]|nr:hypothetical protein [Nonomuraea muscovyensis]